MQVYENYKRHASLLTFILYFLEPKGELNLVAISSL